MRPTRSTTKCQMPWSSSTRACGCAGDRVERTRRSQAAKGCRVLLASQGREVAGGLATLPRRASKQRASISHASDAYCYLVLRPESVSACLVWDSRESPRISGCHMGKDLSAGVLDFTVLAFAFSRLSRPGFSTLSASKLQIECVLTNLRANRKYRCCLDCLYFAFHGKAGVGHG